MRCSEKKCNIIFVVVLYKKPPLLSETIKSLSVHKFENYGISPSFAIWDNSSAGYGKESLNLMPGKLFYYHTGKNEKLSYIYNKIVSNNKSDWYVFLDDDSFIGSDYLDALIPFFDSEVNVAIPKIIYDDVIISPGMVKEIKGKRLSSDKLYPGKRKSKSIAAMMSGTIVSNRVFETGVLFDEKISFYGVDTRFFIEYSKVFEFIYILDVVIPHHSALRDKDMPVSEQVERHRKLTSAWPLIFRDAKFFRVKLFLYISYYALKLSITKRDPRFLLVLLSIFSLFKTKS